MSRPILRHRALSIVSAVAISGLVTVFGIAGTAGAAASDGATPSGKGKPTATLQILEPSVSVQRAGKDVFKPAKEGQKLRVGDTVQTDATGFAQVTYTDESLTRLDVNTTFTIVSLTDDEGNRQIKGSVESGQTWNRTSALTESESFEQEGAGATAAVTGTAFNVNCTATTPPNCTFTSVIDGITLTTVDGEIQNLDPLQQCDSTEVETDVNADLCATVTQLTPEALLAYTWILENLYLDGLAGFEGIVVVEGGEVTSFTPAEPPAPPSPPVIDANPVNITSTGENPAPGATTGPNTKVVSRDDQEDVTFVLQVTNPEGGTFWIVFTDLPAASFGRLFYDAGDAGLQPVDTVTLYDPNAAFTFDPVDFDPLTCGEGECFGIAEEQSSPDDPDQTGGPQSYPGPVTDNGDGTMSWFDSFSFIAESEDGIALTSTEVTVVLEVVGEEPCSEVLTSQLQSSGYTASVECGGGAE